MSKQSEAKQQAILETVERLAHTHSRMVSPQEVADSTHIPLRTVNYHARRMAEAGKLSRSFHGRGLNTVKAAS